MPTLRGHTTGGRDVVTTGGREAAGGAGGLDMAGGSSQLSGADTLPDVAVEARPRPGAGEGANGTARGALGGGGGRAAATGVLVAGTLARLIALMSGAPTGT